MRYKKKLCPRCPEGLMRILKSETGFYYRCERCGGTLDNEPDGTPAHDPVFLKFPARRMISEPA